MANAFTTPTGGQTDTQSLPEAASLCSLGNCPPALPLLAPDRPDACLTPSPQIRAHGTQHAATHTDRCTGPSGRERPQDPTPGPTDTPPPHKHVALDPVQGDGEAARVIDCPFPPLSQHASYRCLARNPWPSLPSLCLKDPSWLESPLASQPPFPPVGKYPLSGRHLFPFPSAGPTGGIQPQNRKSWAGAPRGPEAETGNGRGAKAS